MQLGQWANLCLWFPSQLRALPRVAIPTPVAARPARTTVRNLQSRSVRCSSATSGVNNFSLHLTKASWTRRGGPWTSLPAGLA